MTASMEQGKETAQNINVYCPAMKKRRNNVPICKIGSDHNKKMLCMPAVRDGRCPKGYTHLYSLEQPPAARKGEGA